MIELVNSKSQVLFGNDSIVIQKFIAGIKGGRNLDVTGFAAPYIKAGHVIITDGAGVYKPMPLNAALDAYEALPGGYSYAGILYRSILTNKPFAAIMTEGQVNSECLPFDTTGIKAAFTAACPLIEFIKDEASV